MKKLLLRFFGFLIITTNGVAQAPPKKDSLLQLLKTTKEDTSKIRLILLIQKIYSSSNFDSSLYYLNLSNELAQKLKTDKFDFFINVGFAEYYYYNNDYRKALSYALNNKEIAEKQNDMKLLAKSYNNLAAV